MKNIYDDAYIDGTLTLEKALTIAVSTGTAPLTVSSQTKVGNLNVDLLDGYHATTSNDVNSIVVRDGNKNITVSGISASYLSLPAHFSGGYIDGGMISNSVLDTHPESNITTVPFLANDIAYVTLRGGSCTTSDGSLQLNMFDGSASYAMFDNTN